MQSARLHGRAAGTKHEAGGCRADGAREVVVASAPMPSFLRHGLIAVGSVLWIAGLWAQLHSFSATATYMVLSLLIAITVIL
jgi:hypothetical protein